jgi:peptidoglycan/xylan/chitin deacetylase (PgdA/CDA1 family)
MKVYTCFPGGKAKALTRSYDDGKLEDIRLLEIFNKYGIKGTFNLNYGEMQKDQSKMPHPRIPKEQIKDLYVGHEIATHTMTHPTITRCPLVGVANELLEDRKGLEEITGTIIRGHAYPNGSYSEEVKRIFKDAGIAYARTVNENVDQGFNQDFDLPTDWMEWNTTCHHKHNLMALAKRFAEFKKHL